VWCAGACILVSRHATETSGFHRGDFRILGEDLEYSLRLSDRHRCVFFPKLVAGHLSPPRPPGDTRTAHRAKFACLLRNLSYLSFHIPHRAHLRRYLPGNFRRFFRTFGLSSATLAVALKCFWLGAVRGSPAGETQMAQGKGRQ
jgi:GT2 family glycosyltransferase